MIRSKQQRRRDRRKIDNANPPLTPMATVVSVVASGASQVTVTFNSVVQLDPGNLPQSWKFGTGAHLATNAETANGIVWILPVAGTVAAAQVYTMPGSDPAARTPLGGYVATSNGNLA